MNSVMHKSLIENLNEAVPKQKADTNCLTHFCEACLSQCQIIWNSQQLTAVLFTASVRNFNEIERMV